MKKCVVWLGCALLLASAGSVYSQQVKTGKAGTEGVKGATMESAAAADTTGAMKETAAPADRKGAYVQVHEYDPARNAEVDLQLAVAEAKRTNKRVLLEVGGLWCSWCHRMDEFFQKNSDVLEFREKNFVMLKINMSDENKNELLLGRFPKIEGYPHIFVLDNDGKLVHSQDTGDLEQGKGYDLDKFRLFLTTWATAASDVAQQ
jgi:thiol:disulfide interchange protein